MTEPDGLVERHEPSPSSNDMELALEDSRATRSYFVFHCQAENFPSATLSTRSGCHITRQVLSAWVIKAALQITSKEKSLLPNEGLVFY